jgi:hypothetical protein
MSALLLSRARCLTVALIAGSAALFVIADGVKAGPTIYEVTIGAVTSTRIRWDRLRA